MHNSDTTIGENVRYFMYKYKIVYNDWFVTAALSEQLTLSFYSIFICVVFVTFREVM